MAKLDRYILCCAKTPDTWDAPIIRNGRVYHDFPPPLSVAAILMKNGFEGGNREKIWMTTGGEAHHWAVAFNRLEGKDTRLVTDHDREFMAGIKKQRVEKAAKAKEELRRKIDRGGLGDA